MADLEFSGGLEISEGLQSIEQLGAALEERLQVAVGAISFDQLASGAADAVGSALDQPIPIEVDASRIPAEVEAAIADTQLELPLGADTAPATAAVSDLVAGVDAEAASITVDADTTEAAAALDDLASSATGAGQSLSGASGGAHEFGLSTGQLAGVAGLAVGEVGSLREASSLLGERTAAATAGVLGLGVGVAELYHQGLNAVSAEERFTAALGDQAEAVRRVDVGSLSTDLFKLGAQFGSADAAMRNATTSVYQFAINSNASAPQARDFADGIAAISARAVATKPSVGDIADVMDRAAIGIGRARTAASLLNVGLSTTEVNTRAAALAQANGETSASAYDKSLAALQITVERFGPSLKANIEEGSRNAANQAKAAKAEFDNALESFGKPLVAPGLELIKASIPVASELGKALAEVGTVALPLVSGALEVLGPLVGPVLVTLLAVKGVQIGSEVAVALLQQASAWGILGAEAATSAAEQGAAIYSTEVSMATLRSVAIDAAIAGFAAFEGTTFLLHRVFDSVDVITPALHDVTAAAKDTATATDGDLVPSFDRLLVKVEALRQASGASITPDEQFFDWAPKADAATAATESFSTQLQAFRAVAEQSLPTAAKLADGVGRNTDLGQAYARILADVAGKQHDAKQATDDLAGSQTGQNLLLSTAYQSLSDYAAGTGSATQALADLSAAQKEENDQITLYKNNLLALQGVQGDITAATIAFNNAQQGVLDSLAKNGLQFDLNTQAGRDNVSALQSAVTTADALAEATYKSELATKGETQARADADGVLANFKTGLDNTLISLGLNYQQIKDLETALGLLHSPPPIVVDVNTDPAYQKIRDLIGTLGTLDQAAANYAVAAYGPGAGSAAAGPLSFLDPNNPNNIFHQLTGRASGGPVEAGVPYLVNEDTPRSEIFVSESAGTIYTQAVYPQGGGGAVGSASSGGTVDNSVSIQVDARGVTSPEEVARRTAQKQVAMQHLLGT